MFLHIDDGELRCRTGNLDDGWGGGCDFEKRVPRASKSATGSQPGARATRLRARLRSKPGMNDASLRSAGRVLSDASRSAMKRGSSVESNSRARKRESPSCRFSHGVPDSSRASLNASAIRPSFDRSTLVSALKNLQPRVQPPSRAMRSSRSRGAIDTASTLCSYATFMIPAALRRLRLSPSRVDSENSLERTVTMSCRWAPSGVTKLMVSSFFSCEWISNR